ncbi:MAG: proton-conducting transporter membrane subunit [Candidatus Nomurabacteria bacterium]|nr:proton-conducting transporter membrane subunit [Candidatus Nomurabacteria bacterium]
MELLFIFTFLLLASLIGLFTKKRLFIEFVSVFASIFALFGSINVAMKVVALGSYSPFSFLYVESFGAVLLLIISLIGLSTTVYSIQYLRQESAKNIIGPARVRQYFVLLNLFILFMFLATTVNSPIFSWIFIEATTLSTVFLISFYNKSSSVEAAWKYLVVNSVGLLFGFFGTLLYFTSLHSVDNGSIVSWNGLLNGATSLDPVIAKIAFIFVLIGYGAKVGLAPMHTWKPDAYSKAPTPLGALFSGALLPVAFVTILKFKTITDTVVGLSFSQNLLILFGTLSVFISAFIIFSSRNYKRLLAYSGIENAGIMALGFGFGGLGIFAGTLHMIYHSLIKSALFFCSGNFLLKYGSAKIKNIRGAINVLPFTSVVFVVGFLALIGMPPFGVFFTKLTILSAGIKNHQLFSIVLIFLVSLLFIGFLKHVTAMVFGKKPEDMSIKKESVWLIIPPLVLIGVVICLSFYIPPFLYTLFNNIVLHY